MILTQKVLDTIPDELKIRVFKLDEIEKWFLKITRKAIKKTRNLANYTREDIEECEGIKREMEWILNNAYKDGRFQEYFLQQIKSVNEYIKILSGY
jgi:hypothetical protein